MLRRSAATAAEAGEASRAAGLMEVADAAFPAGAAGLMEASGGVSQAGTVIMADIVIAAELAASAADGAACISALACPLGSAMAITVTVRTMAIMARTHTLLPIAIRRATTIKRDTGIRTLAATSMRHRIDGLVSAGR